MCLKLVMDWMGTVNSKTRGFIGSREALNTNLGIGIQPVVGRFTFSRKDEVHILGMILYLSLDMDAQVTLVAQSVFH